MVVSGGLPKIDRTPKVFYGGKQKRPDATYVRPVVSPSGEFVGQVAEGNRKDIRNAVEAAHESIFVAGWRPFIGWACGIALVYHFLLEPIIQYILIISNVPFTTPEFDFSQLSTIVMAMLGMSGLRTYEKVKN